MVSLKIANYNISGGFYIGNEDTEYLDRKAATGYDNKLLDQIINTIKEENIDVICFQEIITTDKIQYIQNIAKNTCLKYFDMFELSPCNIVKDTNCGLAILSKFPIKNTIKEFFPNPKLSKTTSSGNTYYTFDKGYMYSKILIQNKPISILTHHGFPYRRFNSTPESNVEVFNFFNDKIKDLRPEIITGDFNAENFMNLIKVLPNNYKRTINDITTVDGKSFDDILINKNFKYSSKIIKLLSDHFLIVTSINLN